ncbi:PTS sugar transporter subunit IIA [Lysinibacter sp. HNR]|uniref:PTS sugar transporter subunit IIA n=1 Tax=Lysinibacter sp. HNR TaxID=3031408 RepID=UPI002434DC93|nr:PTS sugar transporter subunit IIA [Lysinibacter sp. HNR]WGD36497.1 PTS sugar transporter subunit IIA [Lysinibacter sp. HNR]
MTVDFAHELPLEAIAIQASASSWQEALGLAGWLLVNVGITTAEYTSEMITAVNTLGPYIVIAPGIALAHSRPSPAVLRTGLSWVTLAEPVVFGHTQNDPVDLIIGLAAMDHDSHLGLMSSLATLLMDPNSLAELRAAESPQHLHDLLEKLAGEAA